MLDQQTPLRTGWGAGAAPGSRAQPPAQAFPERADQSRGCPSMPVEGTDLLLRALAPHFAEAIDGDVFVSNTRRWLRNGSSGRACGPASGRLSAGLLVDHRVHDPATGARGALWHRQLDTDLLGFAASPTPVLRQCRQAPSRRSRTWSPPWRKNPAAISLRLLRARRDHASDHGSPPFPASACSTRCATFPFQGSGPALQGMAAGTIQFFGDTELLMASGDFRPLLVFKRHPARELP